MNPEWFGGRLRELREQAGLTQQDLADKSGMSKFGIAKLEQCVAQPSWATVVALCQALGVNCDQFMIEPGDKPAPGPGRPRKAEEEPADGKPGKAAGKPATVRLGGKAGEETIKGKKSTRKRKEG